MLPETASDDGNDATKLLRREDGEERNPLYPGCGAEHVHLSSEVSVRFDHFVDHFGIDVVRVGQDCAVLGERVIYTVIRTTTEYSSKRSFYENIWHGLSPVPHFFGLLAVLLLRDSRLSALPIVREPVRD